MTEIKVGPILGFEEGNYYTVCVLTNKTNGKLNLSLEKELTAFQKITDTPQGAFWRAEIQIPASEKGKFQTYQILEGAKPLDDFHGRATWSFYVPGKNESPRIAYASCNGFSDGKKAATTRNPFLLWDRMVNMHGKEPFSLLLMGGDQVYADEIWERSAIAELNKWRELPEEKKIKCRATPELKEKLDEFYENLYIQRWRDFSLSAMLASIPSVMMWDDHDIFDGWGSYPDELQTCDVFKNIFGYARKYFELFQIRSRNNRSLLSSKSHYSLGFTYRDCLLLSLDNRSERTLTQIMSKKHWDEVKEWLTAHPNGFDTFLLMTAVPVVYRSFSKVEAFFAATPWMEELEDDVNDHWTAKRHQGERMKLIMNLLEFAPEHDYRSVILSGDVHVGGLGLIKDSAKNREIYQVISTGIVHPAPSVFEWLGIRAATSDDPEVVGNGDLTMQMIDPIGSDRYIVTRNFATLHEGTDKKLWVNWICEKDIHPVFVVDKKNQAGC